MGLSKSTVIITIILLVANLLGTEKRILLVIGKPKKPRCFKNVVQLPVNYRFNKRSRMTSEIFSKERME
jgi:hypothetical protein